MKIIITILFILPLIGLSSVYGSYFPDPTPTAEWDLIRGEIFGGAFPIGGEVAAWDAGGTIRFRATIDTMANFFGILAFFGPPTGSTDPHDFTWKVFDGSSEYSATVHDAGTTWANYIGGTPGGTFVLNLDRGGTTGTVPEPATYLILALLAGSGLAIFRKKN